MRGGGDGGTSNLTVEVSVKSSSTKMSPEMSSVSLLSSVEEVSDSSNVSLVSCGASSVGVASVGVGGRVVT